MILHILFSISAAIATPPARIVALQPSLAESAAWVLGPAQLNRIVGVTDYTDTPVTLAKLPSVGSYARFSIERVMALKPDLVLASPDGNPLDQVEKLKSLHVRVEVLHMNSLSEIESAFEKLTKLLGMEGDASVKSRLSIWKKDLASIRLDFNYKRKARSLKVAIQLGDAPLVFLGGTGFIAEAVALAGVTNIFQDLKLPFHRPSQEAVLARKPDLILILQMGSDADPYLKMKKNWEQVSAALPESTRARILVHSLDELMRPGPRILIGIQKLREILDHDVH